MCIRDRLIVDAAQGIEAQTVTNYLLAIDNDLEIIPVINKVDLPNADIENVTSQIIELVGCSKDEILLSSAKTGEGIEHNLTTIILSETHYFLNQGNYLIRDHNNHHYYNLKIFFLIVYA